MSKIGRRIGIRIYERQLFFKNSYVDENLLLSEEETLLSFNKQCKAVKKDLWRDVELQDVEKIPYDIDGLSTYRLVSPNCNLLLQKVKDGRPWKKNSSTKWSDLKKFDLKIVVLA